MNRGDHAARKTISMWVGLGQLARVAITALTFTGFYAGGLALSWLVLPIVSLLGGGQLARTQRAQTIVRAGFRLFHDAMRWGFLLHSNPRQAPLNLPAGPCVVVANHPTLVDVTAVLAAAPTMACVVKGPLFRGLLLGNLMRQCWHIDGGMGSALDNAAVLEQAAQRLAVGTPVLIFPEGTRSPEQGLHPFKRGAFEMAVRANVPVVLLLLHCYPAVLAKTAPWYRAPATIPTHGVSVITTMAPSEFANDSKAMVAAAMRIYSSQILATSSEQPIDIS
ncbi:MAG: 1-acyl-sn-glycerol-3-phosphate acyltransferase [Myxococcales bacterium]|nr:1-acyl-sn-glycerol-3-phosphate acyltransferase [Myxococcales bacterium]